MRGSRGVMRVGMIAVACVVGLSACRDNGLPDRNLPLQEARHRTYGYPVYEPTANNAPLAMAGRHWLGTLPVESIPNRMLVSIGTAEGTPLYALKGESAPHSRLYAPVGENRWRPYLRLN